MSEILDSAQKLATAIGAPALTVAIMYYFGWVRTERAATVAGVPQTLFGLSVTDYVLRGAAPVITILGLALGAGVAAVFVYWLLESRLWLRGRRARMCMLLVGLIVLVSNTWALVSEAPTVESLRRQGIWVAGAGILIWLGANGTVSGPRGAGARYRDGLRTVSHIVLGLTVLFGLFTVVRSEATRDGEASIVALRERILAGDEPVATLAMTATAPALHGASAMTVSGDGESVRAELSDVFVLLESDGRVVVVSSCFAWGGQEGALSEVAIIESDSIERMRFTSGAALEGGVSPCVPLIEAAPAEVSEEAMSGAFDVIAEDPDNSTAAQATQVLSDAITHLIRAAVMSGDPDAIAAAQAAGERLADLNEALAAGNSAAIEEAAGATAAAVDVASEVTENAVAASEAEQAAANHAVEQAEHEVAKAAAAVAAAAASGADEGVQDALQDALDQTQNELDDARLAVTPTCSAKVDGDRVVITWDPEAPITAVLRDWGRRQAPNSVDLNAGVATDAPGGSGNFVYRVWAGDVSGTCVATVEAITVAIDTGFAGGCAPGGAVPTGPDITPVDRVRVDGAAFGVPGTEAYCGSSGPTFLDGDVLVVEIEGTEWEIVEIGDTPLTHPTLNQPQIVVDASMVGDLTDQIAEQLQFIDVEGELGFDR
ncbi:MAG: hypothetical protein AAF081_05055 [Actinomycetota bacterium]